MAAKGKEKQESSFEIEQRREGFHPVEDRSEMGVEVSLRVEPHITARQRWGLMRPHLTRNVDSLRESLAGESAGWGDLMNSPLLSLRNGKISSPLPKIQVFVK